MPRVPLTAAEQRVDFPAHNSHIVDRRAATERNAKPAARRLAHAVAYHGLPTRLLEQQLEGALYASLVVSVDFGYRQVQRELRAEHGGLQAAVRLPGIGDRGRVVLRGLDGVHALVRSRAQMVATDVAEAATAAAHHASLAPGASDTGKAVAVSTAVEKTLHNDVLQLVGEALNLGRMAGAVESRNPPEFALRSEQLDKNTCEACDRVHGEIVRVDSSEFYALMPPSECFGGGRCRGIYVFGA